MTANNSALKNRADVLEQIAYEIKSFNTGNVHSKAIAVTHILTAVMWTRKAAYGDRFRNGARKSK
jgi:hypothetical protein